MNLLTNHICITCRHTDIPFKNYQRSVIPQAHRLPSTLHGHRNHAQLPNNQPYRDGADNFYLQTTTQGRPMGMIPRNRQADLHYMYENPQ